MEHSYTNIFAVQILIPQQGQKRNDPLDDIASSHVARRTFATTMTLGKGVPIESVSKMLGHTNIQTTQIYARITNDKISSDMEKLSQNLGNLDF